jgi:diguanylate cyclase (GGDEF)-like protein
MPYLVSPGILLLLCLLVWAPLAYAIDELIKPDRQLPANIIPIVLTDAEQAWLKQNPRIRVAVKDGWMPIEFKLESGKHQGLSVDYLRHLSNLLGIEFEVINYIENIGVDKADVISGIGNVRSLHGTDYQAITQPFLSLPFAIYTNRHEPSTYAVSHLNDLRYLNVAVFRSGMLGRSLRKNYPDINLVYVDIADEAFDLLKSGDVDAYVGNEMVLDYHISIHRLRYVEKRGITEFNTTVSMAVRKDWPMFNSILTKGIAHIGTNNQAIVTKWHMVDASLDTISKLFLGILFAILMILLFSSYRLKQRLRKQSLESEHQIWKRANFDFLTQLPNRHLFQNRLDQALSRTNRSRLSVGLLFIDLDNFKHVNDQSGHAFGDKLLIQVANRIGQCVRAEDTAARFGGDEFVVLITDLKDTLYLETICQKILDELQRPFSIDGKDILISASIGVAIYPDDTHYPDELLSFADKAMYQAKKLGRNQFHFFTEAIQAASISRLSTTNDLRIALKKQQFVLYYQPIINMQDFNTQKAEVLVRWNHPLKGLTGPVEFIPITEETGLIKQLGQWVFTQAVEELKTIHQSIGTDFQLSINVSPQQFQAPQDLLYWIDLLKAHGIPGRCISLEITEGLLLDANPQVKSTLSAFRDYGIEVSIDDFGTGYSALSYLKKFDIDYVKIDQSFVQSLESNNYDAVLCEAIIEMAHKLGIQVIAEGIETDAQRTTLAGFSCDFGQGYLFARPAGLEDLIAALKSYPIRKS